MLHMTLRGMICEEVRPAGLHEIAEILDIEFPMPDEGSNERQAGNTSKGRRCLPR
jgi:hypothetical protein